MILIPWIKVSQMQGDVDKFAGISIESAQI